MSHFFIKTIIAKYIEIDKHTTLKLSSKVLIVQIQLQNGSKNIPKNPLKPASFKSSSLLQYPKVLLYSHAFSATISLWNNTFRYYFLTVGELAIMAPLDALKDLVFLKFTVFFLVFVSSTCWAFWLTLTEVSGSASKVTPGFIPRLYFSTPTAPPPTRVKKEPFLHAMCKALLGYACCLLYLCTLE